jgi:polysaccharide biosynthesis protein PslH
MESSIVNRLNRLSKRLRTPRKNALLICAALPQLGSAGNLSYLYSFLDYLASRGFSVTVLIVGYRLPKLLFRLSEYIPFPNVRLAGDGLVRFGDWILVTKAGAWRRAIYSRVMDSQLPFLRSLANHMRQRHLREAQVIMGHFAGAAEVAAAQRWITQARADVVLVDTIFLSAFQRALPTGARSIIVTHDVFHERCASFISRRIKVAPLITAAIERDALKGFDAIVAISGEDAGVFASLAPDASIVTFPSPVTPTAPSKGNVRSPRGRSILFIGSKTSHNVDGLLWFFEEVWAGVRRRHPSATLDVVGSVCEEISGPYTGVTKHHIVKDLADVAQRASFAINPIRSGSGLKIKMLDYLAHGLPFVTSPLGVQGFPRSGAEPFIVCNDAASFCEAVNLLLAEPEALWSMSQRCAPYAEQFSRGPLFAKLDRAFEEKCTSREG